MIKRIYQLFLILVFGAGIALIFYSAWYKTDIKDLQYIADKVPETTTKQSDSSKQSEQVETTKTNVFDDKKKNVGLYIDYLKEVEDFDTLPQIIGWFETFESVRSSQVNTKLILAHQTKLYTPLIVLEPSDVSLKEIADGEYDEKLKNYFNTIYKECKDQMVIIRFAHEMEWYSHYDSGWYPWQGEGNETVYIEAWKRIVKLSRETKANIKWLWSPNRARKETSAYYPGDDYVDYVGITLNRVNDNKKTYKTFKEFYETEGQKSFLEAYHKPIILSEVAYASNNLDEKNDYIDSMFDYLLEDDAIKGIVYFNHDKGGNHYALSNDASHLEHFKEGLKKVNDSNIKKE